MSVRIKATVKVRVYLLRLVFIYQAYCTLVVRYFHVTGGISITFPISRYTGVSAATAYLKTIQKFIMMHNIHFHSVVFLFCLMRQNNCRSCFAFIAAEVVFAFTPITTAITLP